MALSPDQHLKRPCATLVRLVGRAINTVDLISWIQLKGHTSDGRGISGTDLVGCVTSLEWHTKGLRRLSPLTLTFLREVRFFAWSLMHLLFRGMPTEPEAFWGMPGASGLRSCAETTLKRPCATLVRLLDPVDETHFGRPWYLVGCITSQDSVVSRGCLVRGPGRPSIRITRPRLTFLEPHGAVSPGSNPPRWR